MKERIKIATRENIIRMIGIASISQVIIAVAIRWEYISVDWIIYLTILASVPLFGARLALRDIPATD